MKTFNDIRNSLVVSFEGKIDELKNTNDDSVSQFKTPLLIDRYKNYIDNIDEITEIEIGAIVKYIIEKVKEACSRFPTQFFSHFKEPVALCLEKNKKAVEDVYTILDISLDDLAEYFQGKNPSDKEVQDQFIEFVNFTLGTRIPKIGVEEEAMSRYLNLLKSSTHDSSSVGEQQTSVDIACAYCYLKDIQIASGTAKLGGVYSYRASDKEYLQHKEFLTSIGLVTSGIAF